MRRSLLVAFATILLPSCSLWAGGGSTTYYSKLTVQRAGSGAGKIYAANEAADAPAYQTATMTPSISNTSTSHKYYLYADAPVGTAFKGWSATGATLASTTALATTATITASGTSESAATVATVTATFEEIAYASYSVTYAKPTNGTVTVDGVTVGAAGLVAGPFTKAYTPALVAQADPGYAFGGWYATVADGSRTLLSRSASMTPAFEAETSVAAEFVPTVPVTTYAALETSLADNACTLIPAGTTIVIPTGATLVVGDGRQLVVDGALQAIGALVNNGEIGGAGVIGDIVHTVSQTGNGMDPIVTATVLPGYQKKYYKTTCVSGTSNVSGMTPDCTVLKGAHLVRNGVEIATTTFDASAKPVVLACSVDSAKAVNHLTGFLATPYYESVGAGLAAMKGKGVSQLAILLSSQKLDQSGANAAGILVTQGNYQKLDGNFGVMDLAGKTLTVSTSYINSYSHVVLNGGLSVTTLMYSGTVSGINCSSISFSKIKEDYASVINVYDLTGTSSKIIAAYNGSNAIKNAVNFYSSSTAIYSSSQFLAKAADSYHIYGGTWAAKPDAKYIASALAADYAFYPTTEGATAYSLQPKADREVVTFSTGEKYETFDEAVEALSAAFASSDSVSMTLNKSATLEAPITIPLGKTLEVELAGCCLTATGGFAINHGTLILGDNRGNLEPTGGRIVSTDGRLLENDGSVDVTYGYYTGAIVLKGGSFTTHHGRFVGTIAAADKVWADLRGGYFDTDVSALLKDGYFRTGGYVGPFPKPSVTKSWQAADGGYWLFNMKILPEDELALYNGYSNLKSGYEDLETWRRAAEVKSMVTPYANAMYMMDIGCGFDRDVASGSATARMTSPVSVSQALGEDVSGGTLYRVLSPYIVSQKATQKKYPEFLSSSTFQSTVFGVSSSAADNRGTTVNLRVDMCTGANDAPTSLYAVMSEYAVLGAGRANQAMIRPATGAATFYATLAEAVAADAADGAVIRLCNDITTTETVTVSKPCTIDTNGMVFNGSVVAGRGYELTVSSSVPSVERRCGKVQTTYTVTRKPQGMILRLR